MVAEVFINASNENLPVLVRDLGGIASWLQAIGVVLVLWLIFNIIGLLVNYKRKRVLDKLEKDIRILDRKVSQLLKK
ncbi:MAG: hypothetical protein KKB31_04600 [Nanoarchaeota archaeon]|nr:hypothetical protein [Nanoarchaeota archaeon]